MIVLRFLALSAFFFGSIHAARKLRKKEEEPWLKILEHTESMPLTNGQNPENILHDKYVNEATQVMLGVVLENHTPYDLEEPGWNIEDCSATRAIMDVTTVSKKTAEMFLFDNEEWRDYGVCGSMHWQIAKKQGKSIAKQRLVVTFRVPYAGDCNSQRGNSFSLYMYKLKLNEDNQWRYPHQAKNDYYHLHGTGGQSVFQAEGRQQLLVSLENGQYFVAAEIDNACNALLKIKLFTTLEHHKYQLELQGQDQVQEDQVQDQSIEPSLLTKKPTNANQSPKQQVDGQTMKAQSMTMTLLMWFGIGMGAFILVLLMIIGLASLAKRRRNNRRY